MARCIFKTQIKASDSFASSFFVSFYGLFYAAAELSRKSCVEVQDTTWSHQSIIVYFDQTKGRTPTWKKPHFKSNMVASNSIQIQYLLILKEK